MTENANTSSITNDDTTRRTHRQAEKSYPTMTINSQSFDQ